VDVFWVGHNVEVLLHGSLSGSRRHVSRWYIIT